jgi:hypothetical protein
MYENVNELKTVDSMPGSINELISTNNRLKRPPSLSESFAWTPENIARANRIPLISLSDKVDIDDICPVVVVAEPSIKYWKYEKPIVEVFIKLLLHIVLISIFETLFYFLYVSSLENNGIETTVNTFINDAVTNCMNISPLDIQVIDDFLDPYINATQVIATGNNAGIQRMIYNELISRRAWAYVGGLMGLFMALTVYIRCRRIKINWWYIIFENTSMVVLLALYELMFFNTIIYSYEPISTDEISRDAIRKFQGSCGILK